jgi:hypothetical protein
MPRFSRPVSAPVDEYRTPYGTLFARRRRVVISVECKRTSVIIFDWRQKRLIGWFVARMDSKFRFYEMMMFSP